MDPSAAGRTAPASTVPPPVDAEPQDRCMRCGRPTPAGVSLCEADNPGRVRSPSTTQVHGTILVGVILGFVVIALAARFAVAGGGPFVASVHGAASRPDGAVELVVSVRNDGERASAATCRIAPSGVPSPTDVSFQTPRIDPGASVAVQRILSRPTGSDTSFRIERIAVTCG